MLISHHSRTFELRSYQVREGGGRHGHATLIGDFLQCGLKYQSILVFSYLQNGVITRFPQFVVGIAWTTAC